MDFKEIEQLLERYWRCETSLEEEARLRAFFNKEELPAHLRRYKELFVYQQLQQEAGLGDDFDARLLAEVEVPVVKARRLTLKARLMPLFKAVAVVAVILLLGNVMQHPFFGGGREVPATDTIGKQISAPSVALSGEATDAAHEQLLLDSLQRLEKKQAAVRGVKQ